MLVEAYTRHMYVTAVPNRNSPPAILLRESFRQDGVVKNRTLANLSSWPAERVNALRRLLRGELDHLASLTPVCGPVFGLLHALFLYDVTSAYLEGEHNAMGAFGYNRDGKRGKLQIVIGLLTDPEGEPLAVREIGRAHV